MNLFLNVSGTSWKITNQQWIASTVIQIIYYPVKKKNKWLFPLMSAKKG